MAEAKEEYDANAHSDDDALDLATRVYFDDDALEFESQFGGSEADSESLLDEAEDARRPQNCVPVKIGIGVVVTPESDIDRGDPAAVLGSDQGGPVAALGGGPADPERDSDRPSHDAEFFFDDDVGSVALFGGAEADSEGPEQEAMPQPHVQQPGAAMARSCFTADRSDSPPLSLASQEELLVEHPEFPSLLLLAAPQPELDPVVPFPVVDEERVAFGHSEAGSEFHVATLADDDAIMEQEW